MRHRTPAHWPTRILLGVGIAVVVLVGLILWLDPEWSYTTSSGSVVSWSASAGLVLPFGLAIIGLVWMILILRGPRDDPPS